MQKHKLELLKIIGHSVQIGKPAIFSFSSLAEVMNLPNDQLDSLLDDLEKDRFITQFVIQDSDNFKLILHQNGYDTLETTF